MDIDKLAQDAERFENGQWVTMDEGYSVKIRGAQSTTVRVFQQKQLERHKKTIRRGRFLSVEAQDRDAVELLCEAIVLDWKGLESEGEPLEWSPTVGRKIFSDPRFLQMREDILQASNDLALFAEEDMAEDLGN